LQESSVNTGGIVVYLQLFASHKRVWSLHELLKVFEILNVVIAYSSLAVVVGVLVLYSNFLHFHELLNLVQIGESLGPEELQLLNHFPQLPLLD